MRADTWKAGERRVRSQPPTIAAEVVPAAITQKEPATPVAAMGPPSPKPEAPPEKKLPASGTVVLEVEEGGIAVPSFLGKNVRSAVEAAQDVGLDLDAICSSVAPEACPPPGAQVTS